MSENKNLLINLVPDAIDNATKNLTDKPTQNMGTTLADIWYLVFGGISQAAEKRKLKYSYTLQEFEKELKEKMSKIPEDKSREPDIQVIAPALEASKYCLENEKLRNMFSNLITSNMHIDICNYSQPIFIDILKNLNQLECIILNSIYSNKNINIKTKNYEGYLLDLLFQISISINQLYSYGLTTYNMQNHEFNKKEKKLLLQYIKEGKIEKVIKFFNLGYAVERISIKTDKTEMCSIYVKLKPLPITPLGIAFKIICIDGIDKYQ